LPLNSFSILSDSNGCMYHFIVEFTYFLTAVDSGDKLN